MSTKKSLLALAMTALALMGFASSAMAATDGKVVDVTNAAFSPVGRVFHYVGWAKFTTARGSFECHVTATSVLSTTTTGTVTGFNVPDTTKCTGTGFIAGCKLKAGHQSTNLPYHLTVTPTDFDVSGNIVIDSPLEGFLCPNITLTFTENTLDPLSTVNKKAATGTNGNLGDPAAAGVPISGVKITGVGVSAGGPFGNEAATASGELELTTEDRCTWKVESD
jgi:hypothetical protein